MKIRPQLMQKMAKIPSGAGEKKSSEYDRVVIALIRRSKLVPVGGLLNLGGWLTHFHVLFFGPFNRIVDFSTMDRNLFGGLDAKAYFVATNFYDNDRDVVVNDDTFVFFPREN
jgi:hypothetical protein